VQWGLCGIKLTAVLTIGNEMPVGSEAILQTVCFFALLPLFLFLLIFLFLFLITPHILNALEKGKVRCEWQPFQKRLE
jgi:hypothetical protein